MKPIKFEDTCKDFGKDQPEYKTLPVLIVQDDQGQVFTSCWKLSFWERIKMIFSGKIYLGILGGQPPVLLSMDKQYKISK